jgi:hypothetical protein
MSSSTAAIASNIPSATRSKPYRHP